jgi:hypothetical protein
MHLIQLSFQRVYERAKEVAGYEQACQIYDVQQKLSSKELDNHRAYLKKISPEKVPGVKQNPSEFEKDDLRAVVRHEIKHRLEKETTAIQQKLEEQQIAIGEIKKLLLELKERN